MNISINDKNKKVAFLDSGIGGLTVYAKFRNMLKTEDCIYFGDIKHLPYGNKSKEELVSYCVDIFDFFKSQNVKAVVMACNTTSASAYPYLSKMYDFKIYPIIQSCAKIIAEHNYSSLGVLATVSTAKSGAYETEIHKYRPDIKIYTQGCPKWADIAERQSQYDDKEIIKNDLDKILLYNPEKIILGCTHYPYLLDILSLYAERERFIDPAEFFVDYIKRDLEKSNLLNSQISPGSEEFFTSAETENFKNAAKMFYIVKDVQLKEFNKKTLLPNN